MIAGKDRWGKGWSDKPSKNQCDIYFSYSHMPAETDLEREMPAKLKESLEMFLEGSP